MARCDLRHGGMDQPGLHRRSGPPRQASSSGSRASSTQRGHVWRRVAPATNSTTLRVSPAAARDGCRDSVCMRVSRTPRATHRGAPWPSYRTSRLECAISMASSTSCGATVIALECPRTDQQIRFHVGVSPRRPPPDFDDSRVLPATSSHEPVLQLVPHQLMTVALGRHRNQLPLDQLSLRSSSESIPSSVSRSNSSNSPAQPGHSLGRLCGGAHLRLVRNLVHGASLSAWPPPTQHGLSARFLRAAPSCSRIRLMKRVKR